MLGISRRIGERIIIGDPANPLGIIKIVGVKGDKVRIGLDFQGDIPVNREELAKSKSGVDVPQFQPKNH